MTLSSKFSAPVDRSRRDAFWSGTRRAGGGGSTYFAAAFKHAEEAV
jgi:hypothetical protein